MYPSIFFYQNKRTDAQYSYTPIGHPDINRLIKHQPYWRTNAPTEELKKKSLILADWSADSWSDEKIAAVQLNLSKLIDDGFEIYIWKNGTIEALTQETLTTLGNPSVLRSIFPHFHHDIIAEAVEKKKLVKDRIHILDDYQINCLLQPLKSESPREIDSPQLKNQRYLSQIFALLSHANPKIEKFLNSEFSKEAIESFQEFRANFPEIPVASAYRNVTLTQKQTSELLKNGRITLGPSSIDENELQLVESLKLFKSTATAEELSSILNKTNLIKKLHLYICNNLTNGKILEQDYPQLEELALKGSLIKTENLKQMLLNAPNLKKLTIQCKGLASTPTIDVNFPLIEEINLYNTDFRCINLNQLLSNTKKLTKLQLSNCQLNDELTINLDFPALRDLDLSNTELPPAVIRRIITAAPNLQKIRLGKYFLDDLSSINFPHLDALDLNYMDLTSDEFQKLLSKAPNIKELKLTNCENLTDDFKKLELSNLRKLEITGSLPPQNLQKLLSGTKKLTTLEFYECNTAWGDLIDTVNLDSIEEISLQECNINAEDLEKLIKAAPKLKKLNLLDCNDLELDGELDELLKIRRLAQHASIPPEPNFNLNETNRQQTAPSPTSKNEAKIDATEKVDADTSETPNKQFNIQRIFYPIDSSILFPAVNLDRLHVFNSVNITPDHCKLDDAFSLNKEGAPKLIPVNNLKACSEDVFALAKTLEKPTDAHLMYGKQSLTLGTEWQAIASLSPNEIMTHYHVAPDTAEIEIQYSLRDNQYYIRSKADSQKINIDFLLKVPNKKLSLPSAIGDLIANYQHFGSGSLDLDKEEPNGHDYLRYIQEQEKGACRHRVIAFKELLKERFPEIPVRIITNGCHAFVEVKIDDQWVGCDLGGYPAKLVINDENNPQENAANQEKRFIKQLETWSKEKSEFASIKHYCQNLLQKGNLKTRLVELSSDQDVNALQLSLQAHCQHTSRPVYYIDSPSDLVCSAPFVERTGTHGIIKEGPGGPLYDFLQAHQDKSQAPVLLVNYAHFNADDIVRFNGLLDNIRHADGTLLPESTLVIGLINPNKPNCYQGEDFYSRFDKVETCPLETSLLKDEAPSLTVMDKSEASSKASTKINLYHASDWEERLLGHWVLHKDNLYFEEGELVAALASGLPIELQNAPWEDEKFTLFWQEAMLHKKIQHAGRTITIPTDLKLLRNEGYDWASFSQTLHLESGIKAHAEVLNPTRISLFFSQHQCDNNSKTLDQVPGILENHAKKRLEVNLTATISEDEWGMLLTACQKHQVELVCHVADGVTLPTALTTKFVSHEVSEAHIWKGEIKNTLVIDSSDPDTTVASLTEGKLDWQVIDVSECQSADLLIAINGQLNQETMHFEFNQSERALLTALASNKKVILKGTFSAELADSLAPLLLERLNNIEVKGQLVIVSDNSKPFNYLAPLQHRVSIEEKTSYLSKHFTSNDIKSLTNEQLLTESLGQLHARLHFHRIHPDNSTDEAWKGMYGLPVAIKLASFDSLHSEEKANAFTKQRIDGVNEILHKQPYVFLTGLTAVGKSTFVEKHLNNSDNTLYQGESQMLAWAQDTSDARKILFIDEANIENRQWSEFEGLFNVPPGILINGQYYPLTDKHKVVFAGNPLNYGGERTLAPFFARHGNALLFETMPQEFIYEAILKPVFANTDIESETLNIALPLLNVYRFLCEHSRDEVVISARELQMMALLVLSSHKKDASTDLIKLAEHYAYQLGKDLVPAEFKMEFNTQFKPDSLLLKDLTDSKAESSDFLITPSRKAAHQQLDELLQLRVLRQKATNPAQKYGGINGIVLEGEPGIGKSEIVISTLVANGYKEVFLKKEKTSEKTFYRMPVSMQFDDKKRLLLKAFDEGAVVVIDEINSSPMMERLLNDLLMGKTPEGKRPAQPGFLIIGTQNPVTMAGRIATGNALARRLIKTILPPYEASEMEKILINKGVEPETAYLMVNAYSICKEKAQKEHLAPEPTFRDLLRLAKQHLIARDKKQHDFVSELIGLATNAGNDQPGKLPPSQELLPLTIDDLLTKFQEKFKNTNSTGVKQMISYMKNIQTNNKSLTEEMKLGLVSNQMHDIATRRKDSSWSKSHFFGNGRHPGVQELYNLLADKDFSLHNVEKTKELLSMIGDENKQFTYNSTLSSH